jgi:DNA-binding helix-hairpin-helix protein with protein kinase domain
MRHLHQSIAGALVLLQACACGPVLAQSRDLRVAPNAPDHQRPEAKPSDQAPGQPANVCRELTAYFQNKRDTASQQAQSGDANRSQANPAQQQSGYSASVSKEANAAPKADQVTVEQVRALTDQNDQRGCQKAVKTMRLAGEALPPGLLALGALREDLLTKQR